MDVTVLLTGTLRGMGLEAPCELTAKRRPATERGKFEYSDVRIIQAPVTLPDGRYTVGIDSQTFAMIRKDGIWRMEKKIQDEAASAAKANASPAVASILGAVRMIRLRKKATPEPARTSEKE